MKRIYFLPLLALMAALLLGTAVARAASGYLFTVNVQGNGKPMILIHGLYGSEAIWEETVNRYRQQYTCHVLTVAGFGGVAPALRDNFLSAVKDDVVRYARENKLQKATLMGHSMGGFLSLWAAASAPGLFDRVIVVDGLPFLAAVQMPGATPESSKPMAEMMRNQLSQQTPEAIEMSQKMLLPQMIMKAEYVDRVAAIAKKADARTQGQVVYELYTTDLRDVIATIDCPVLLLGAWIAYKDYGVTHDSLLESYSAQIKAVRQKTVHVADHAKHFIFYDDPAWFYQEFDQFTHIQ